jgi:predicted amidophosphoribosyltransferase
MPRLIDSNHCPHCGDALPKPAPRVCPGCAGSLQQRHLKAGCISTGPAIFLLGWLVLRSLGA